MNLTIEQKVDLARSDTLAFEDAVILEELAKNPRTPVYVLVQLASHEETWVRFASTQNTYVPISVLERLAQDENFHVRQRVARNANTPIYAITQLANDKYPAVYEEARASLARLSGVADEFDLECDAELDIIPAARDNEQRSSRKQAFRLR